MNAKKFAAAVVLFAAAGAALAQSTEYVAPDANFVSSKSRAEVIAELKQAKAAGLLSYSEHNYPIVQSEKSMQSRMSTHTDNAKSAEAAQFDKTIYFGA
jgi:hypothetical protein